MLYLPRCELWSLPTNSVCITMVSMSLDSMGRQTKEEDETLKRCCGGGARPKEQQRAHKRMDEEEANESVQYSGREESRWYSS